MLVQTNTTTASACYVRYAGNALYLRNDADNGWLGPLNLPAAANLENTQCVLSGAWSGKSGVDTTLTVTLALGCKTGFAGGKNIYLKAANATVDSGWVNKGNWTVGAVTQVPENISVTPSSGTGTTQAFD